MEERRARDQQKLKSDRDHFWKIGHSASDPYYVNEDRRKQNKDAMRNGFSTVAEQMRDQFAHLTSDKRR